MGHKTLGSYKLENVVVRKSRSLQGGEVTYLTSNKGTKINVSEKQIEKSEVVIDELKCHKVKLPAVNVHQINKKFWCLQCRVFKKNISEKRDLFECEGCGKMKMESGLKQSIETKLDFNNEGKRFSVALYGPQMSEYFGRLKTNIPEEIYNQYISDKYNQFLFTQYQLLFNF